MKKSILSLVLVFAIFSLSNCDTAKTSAGGSKLAKETQKNTNQMKEFVKLVKSGGKSGVTQALSKFAATDDLKTHSMVFAGLSDPVVKSQTGNCHTTDFKTSDNKVKTYDICWEKGKIYKITEIK